MKINLKLIRLGLTVLGVIGVPVTSWISVKCHEKAKDAPDKKSKIKAWAPAIISGAATSACIIGSHRAGTKEIAAVTATATYAIANRNKLEEKLAPYIKEETQAKEIKKETALQSIPKKASVEWTGHGTLKVLEGYSGRQFYSSLDSVMAAENKLNKHLKNGEYVCLNDFYTYLGIEQTHFGNQWGWVPSEDYYPYWYEDDPISFENTLCEDADGTPILVIDLYTYPMEGWMEV